MELAERERAVRDVSTASLNCSPSRRFVIVAKICRQQHLPSDKEAAGKAELALAWSLCFRLKVCMVAAKS